VSRIRADLDEVRRRGTLSRDALLFGDVIATSPRAVILNSGMAMTANTPVGVLLYAPTVTPAVTRLTFVQQNASASAATIACSIYTGTDPTNLTLTASGSISTAATVAAKYDCPLSSQQIPAGYVLAIASATTVGATVPSLATTGQAPSGLFTGSAQIASGPVTILTAMVGSTTMTPWPATISVATSNTSVWSASQFNCWFGLG
jgi:hypothetical protein